MFEGSLAQVTLDLVKISSPTGQERELCQALLSWAAGQVSRWREGFVHIPRPLREGKPTIGLVGHIDTVPAAARQRLEIDGDLLYGCGASDMKGGVAVMMAALTRECECNLVGLFYDQEEGPYLDNGLDPLLDLAPPLDLAIVLEPTDNAVQAGCVGSIQARLDFHGQRAHSARPWQGRNAIYEALSFLESLRVEERRGVEQHGLTFYEVLTPTMASTTGPANAVPDLFRVNLNYRFAPGKGSEQALAELRERVAGAGQLEILDVAPAGQVWLDQAQLRRWIAAEQLAVEPKQAWTDVARLTARGVPAVNFGPGAPAQAHQPDEHISIAALERCYTLLASLLGT